ncbi:MAG: hypothetical protein ACOCP8_10270 [archaeon]
MIDNKFEFLFQKNQGISSWDNIPFWEFEEFIKRLNERNKEENKRNSEQQEETNSKMPNMNNFSKMASSYKTPSFNNSNIGTGNFLK